MIVISGVKNYEYMCNIPRDPFSRGPYTITTPRLFSLSWKSLCVIRVICEAVFNVPYSMYS
jgi:hypothetical protein